MSKQYSQHSTLPHYTYPSPPNSYPTSLSSLTVSCLPSASSPEAKLGSVIVLRIHTSSTIDYPPLSRCGALVPSWRGHQLLGRPEWGGGWRNELYSLCTKPMAGIAGWPHGREPIPSPSAPRSIPDPGLVMPKPCVYSIVGQSSVPPHRHNIAVEPHPLAPSPLRSLAPMLQRGLSGTVSDGLEARSHSAARSTLS